jgi:hypothetical protein
MDESKDSFEFDGIACYPAGDDPMQFYYLPAAPGPETGPNGKPNLLLVPTGAGGFLQFGVQFDVPAELLETLRKEIGARFNVANPALIRLTMVPLTVRAVRLLIRGADGQCSEAARSNSSGFPPYTAVFHLQLNPGQQNGLTAALNGRHDCAQVAYYLTLNQPTKATARITGDLRPILEKLSGETPIESSSLMLRRLLDEAIASGQLALTSEATTGASPALVERALEEAKARTVDLLVHSLRGQPPIPDVSRANVAASFTEPGNLSMERWTDVADWFARSEGPGHIMLAPGGGGAGENAARAPRSNHLA